MPEESKTRADQIDAAEFTWSLTDLRRWWGTAARVRWVRAIGLVPARDLTNFGNLV
jgi:hypothetical protein